MNIAIQQIVHTWHNCDIYLYNIYIQLDNKKNAMNIEFVAKSFEGLFAAAEGGTIIESFSVRNKG